MSIFVFKPEKEQVVLVRIINSVQMALEKHSPGQGKVEQFSDNENTEITEKTRPERHTHSLSQDEGIRSKRLWLGLLIFLLVMGYFLGRLLFHRYR